MIEPTCTHTGVFEFLREKFEPTYKYIRLPVEWLTLTISLVSGRHKIAFISSNKIIDSTSASTSGLGGIPGILMALGRPLAPPVTDMLAPVPPLTAVDTKDPNLKLRMQVLKQVSKGSQQERDHLRERVLRQQDELQRHLDYLAAIRNYCT
mmetsp:Transcript_78496/g.211090  ORF Transcript_78496/g.211090 Transcript_78496/m.211090 type:complete len:151 (+) Transcript_78496:333-785(+)